MEKLTLSHSHSHPIPITFSHSLAPSRKGGRHHLLTTTPHISLGMLRSPGQTSPNDHSMLGKPRSGLAWKMMIFCHAGTKLFMTWV